MSEDARMKVEVEQPGDERDALGPDDLLAPVRREGLPVSDQTRGDLASALAAHVADEGEGGTLGAWIVLAENTSLAEYDEGIGSHRVEYGGGYYAIRGLVERWLDVTRASGHVHDHDEG